MKYEMLFLSDGNFKWINFDFYSKPKVKAGFYVFLASNSL